VSNLHRAGLGLARGGQANLGRARACFPDINPNAANKSVFGMLPVLSDDAWVQIGLHLKPRHLYKLMCANKRIKLLVDNEVYWTRVAAHLHLRDHWMLELFSPHEDSIPSNRILPPLDASHYYMVGLDHGYFRAMERFMQRIQDSLEAYTLLGDEDDLAFLSRYQGWSMDYVIDLLVADSEEQDGFPPAETMKETARFKTLSFWKILKDSQLGEHWPKMQKYLCQLEDDPMPGRCKRQVFRSMLETFGHKLQLTGTGSFSFISHHLCIF
jgi:hypothetical protein